MQAMGQPQPPVSLSAKLAAIQELWRPRVVAELNDIQFKLVRIQGDFVWHCHEETDEAFLVISGSMVVEFRDRSVTIREGELFVVPKGEEHITRAEEECCALIVEPRGVVNTGEAGGPLTAPLDQWV
jgi:mannose-6-phosphate isomerase-like protein (cupin superfamily)